jgi:hypothetical protein
MRQFYNKKEQMGRLSKEEIQGSKMHLLTVVSSNDFYDSIVTMRPKLDAPRGAGNNKTPMG